jgi:hypothetical protein
MARDATSGSFDFTLRLAALGAAQDDRGYARFGKWASQLPKMPKLPNIAEIGRCQNHYGTIALVASPCGTI